jgi:methionine synthase I (cobalamin-dependent)/5,10-methylenetetrahydrofolate reductase
MSLTQALRERAPLVCDGAMGTMLHAAGNSLDQALPALNLTNPDLVRAIHDSYVAAGVNLLQTNTFGGGRLRLAEYGHGEDVTTINEAGVRLARAATEDTDILVLGSVSPSVTVQQRGRMSATARRDALREQMRALAGVDALVLETFGYLEELVEAVEVALESAGVPVIAQATFGPDLRLLSGHTAAELAAALSNSGIVALGMNCTLGPQRSLAVLRELRGYTELPLSVQPNAGLPRRIAPARFEYDIDAGYFARYIRQILDAGASIVGGCCGTTPAHVTAAVEAAGMAATASDSARTAASQSAGATAPAERRQAPPGAAREAGGVWGPSGSGVSPGSAAFPPEVAAGSFPPRQAQLIAELIAPAGGDMETVANLAAELTRAGADLVSITPARTYRTVRARAAVIEFAARLHLADGVETIATVTTWDRTIMALQADLLGAHALGLRRIVCETGTPPLVGDYPHVDGVWDVDSTGLIALLSSLNVGTDNYGLELGTKTGFEIGARVNPGSRSLEHEARRALAKVEAGASFLVTRPVYELGGLHRLLEAIDGKVPVLATVAPLASFEEAEWLGHEVPDVVIPASTLAALRDAGDDAARVGADLACELAVQLRGLTAGLVVAAGYDAPTAKRIMTAWR